jgi:hypothetical protein
LLTSSMAVNKKQSAGKDNSSNIEVTNKTALDK